MLRSAMMFSSGTRPAFSVVWARALICGAIWATRLRNSAISGRSDGCAGTSFNWATGTIGLLRVFDGLKGGQVAGAGSRSLDVVRHRETIGRILVDQRLDRIAHVHGLGFADEDRVRAVGYGRRLLAEDIDLRIGEVGDALGRSLPIAEPEPFFGRECAAEGG